MSWIRLRDYDDGGLAADAPAEPPRDAALRAQIKERLDALTEATRVFGDAVANGARPPGVGSSKVTKEHNHDTT